MFQKLRVKSEPKKLAPDFGEVSITQLIEDASLPVSIRALNSLPEDPKTRLYRTLIPLVLLQDLGINPRTWKNTAKEEQVSLEARPDSDRVKLTIWRGADPAEQVLLLELADNQFNGIDLNFVISSDPDAPRYDIDQTVDGKDTGFGTLQRNLQAEEEAMQAGLAPAQVRRGLKRSREIFSHLEIFLSMLAHHAIYLEPLTYASAWLFERRGFAYVQGHQLMDSIHREFQPGGKLHAALDGSTAFRQPDQWRSVRGRAWAIHDGVLDVIDKKWDGLRMVKQVGKHAGAETFPGAIY